MAMWTEQGIPFHRRQLTSWWAKLRGEALRDAVNIETLAAANADELIEFLQRVDRNYFEHVTPSAVASFLANPDDIHVVGRVAGDIVAFGMLRGWAAGFDIPSLGIAVHPEGQGHGRAMMAALERLARDRGSHRIRLRVHPENHRAMRLYKSRGYRVAGMERGEMVMILEL